MPHDSSEQLQEGIFFAGHERLVWKYRALVQALDGTPVADALGFFYMLTGTRNGSP